jgi:hypothetical protein
MVCYKGVAHLPLLVLGLLFVCATVADHSCTGPSLNTHDIAKGNDKWWMIYAVLFLAIVAHSGPHWFNYCQYLVCFGMGQYNCDCKIDAPEYRRVMTVQHLFCSINSLDLLSFSGNCYVFNIDGGMLSHNCQCKIFSYVLFSFMPI